MTEGAVDAQPINVSGKHWVIELTLPVDATHKWVRNKSLNILCDTAERAVEMARKIEPACTIHVCRTVGRFDHNWYLDAQLAEQIVRARNERVVSALEL